MTEDDVSTRRVGTGPAIFTPDDEPYLGLASLLDFDHALIVLMDQQRRIGPWTRAHDLTSLPDRA